MQEGSRPAASRPNRSRRGRGFSSHAAQNNGPRTQADQPPRVSTPPLTAPVPLDTPTFADLGKNGLIDPVLLKTIVEDLKFDHMMPYVLIFAALLTAALLTAALPQQKGANKYPEFKLLLYTSFLQIARIAWLRQRLALERP